MADEKEELIRRCIGEECKQGGSIRRAMADEMDRIKTELRDSAHAGAHKDKGADADRDAVVCRKGGKGCGFALSKGDVESLGGMEVARKAFQVCPTCGTHDIAEA